MRMKVYQLGITVHIFLHLLLACSDNNSSSNDCFLLEVILAFIDMVLRGIPRKVSEVVWPSIFDSRAEMNMIFSAQIV